MHATARADLEQLLRSAWFQPLRPSIMASFARRHGEGAIPCVAVVLDRARDGVLRYDEAGGIIAIALEPTAMPALRNACVGSLLPTERAPLETARDVEAYSVLDGGVVALLPEGVLLYGSRRSVEEAVDVAAKPRALPEHFTLEGDRQVSVWLNLPEDQPAMAVIAELAATDDSLLIEAHGLARSEEAADVLTAPMLEMTRQGRQFSTDRPAIKRLFDAVSLSRNGQRLHLRLDLRGTPDQLARDVDTLRTIGFAAAHTYGEMVEFAAARANLQRIAKNYQEALAASQASDPKRPVRLTSLPAVPPNVPRGTKYQLSSGDWRAWQSIHFSMTGPSSFQYEVTATNGGRRADVIARGDFDGDGVTSEARLSLTLDPSGNLQVIDVEPQNTHE
jgi:hypothetical protein